MPEGPAAESESCPHSDRVGGVRGDGRYAGKQQRWERNEAAPTGDGIQCPAQGRSEKQQRSIRKAEVGKVQSARNVSELGKDARS